MRRVQHSLGECASLRFAATQALLLTVADLGVMGLDDLAQHRLRHDGIHGLQELFSPRGLAVVLEARTLIGGHGQGLLFHWHATFLPLWVWTLIIIALRTTGVAP